MSSVPLANLFKSSGSAGALSSSSGGGISSAGLTAINWLTMLVGFILILVTSAFGMEVLDTYCKDMQYTGDTDDVESEAAFGKWEMVMWGGVGVGVGPFFLFAIWVFFNLGCAKNTYMYSCVLALTIAALIVAMSYGATVGAQMKGLSIGACVGVAMFAGIMSMSKGKTTGGSIMMNIGLVFLLFGGFSAAVGFFAASRLTPCNESRGCFPYSGDGSELEDGEDAPQFDSVCDWSCCDDQSEGTACDEYNKNDASSCGGCQPCVLDSSIKTKVYATAGTGIGLAVVGLALVIIKVAAGVP